MRKKVLHIFLIFITAYVKAQNPHFTQFYALPLNLNPAFTGQTYEHRFVADVRDQWPGVSTTYKTIAASYDYNIASANSGIGLSVLQDNSGTPSISTTVAMLSYAYHFKISKFAEIRAGIHRSQRQAAPLHSTPRLSQDSPSRNAAAAACSTTASGARRSQATSSASTRFYGALIRDSTFR